MNRVQKLAATSAAIAIVASAITPVYAGHRWGRGWGYRHDRVTVDDVVTGIVVIGTLAALANSFKKKQRRDRDDRVERSNDDRDTNYQRGRIANENEAVDACAEAVEDRAGQAASVRRINDVQTKSDGWDVEGTVEKRDGWRSRSSDTSRFTCSVRFGRVESVAINSDNAV